MEENDKPLPPNLCDATGPLIRIGGSVDRVSVSLRLSEDDLDPAEVTNLLGCSPSSSQKLGDTIPDKRYHRIAKTGSWQLEGDDDKSVALEVQVLNLLNRVTDNLRVWKELSSKFKVDVFCGVFLDEWNRGFTLIPIVLKRLADQGIKIGFDIYGQ